jgi:hypothetical protein
MAIVVSCFVLPNEKPNPCNLGTHISEGKASSVRVLLDLAAVNGKSRLECWYPCWSPSLV